MSTEVAEVTQNTGKPGRKYKAGPGRPKGSKNATNIELDSQIVSKKLIGNSNKEIAKLIDKSEKYVATRLEKFRPLFKHLKDVPEYRNGRAELLDAAECQLLKNLVEKADAGSLRENTYAFDKVFTAGRLTRGESTANVSHKVQFTGPQLNHIEAED